MEKSWNFQEVEYAKLQVNISTDFPGIQRYIAERWIWAIKLTGAYVWRCVRCVLISTYLQVEQKVNVQNKVQTMQFLSQVHDC